MSETADQGGATGTTSRYVTAAPDPVRSNPEPHSTAPGAIWPVDEPRYRLMRLCQCAECEGKGKVPNPDAGTPVLSSMVPGPDGALAASYRRSLVRCKECRGEGKTLDEIARCDTPADIGVALVTLATEGEFDGCPFGLIDDQGEPGLKWLVRPWVASPRNVSDAARTLAKSKGRQDLTCRCHVRDRNKRHMRYCPLYVPVKPKWIPRDLFTKPKGDK